MPELKELKSWLWIDCDEVGSTNDEALRLSKDLRPGEKVVITARKQTNGRGRRGRNWISLDGNLFMSMLFSWPLKENGAMPLIVSLAVLNTVLKLSPQAKVKLKWPNDVLLNGCKLSGILLERGLKDNLVVGIGVNIKKAPCSADILYPTTSLQSCDINCTRRKFLKLYLDEFDKIHQLYLSEGMQTIVCLWLQHAEGVNSSIIIHTPRGEERGLFKGLGSDGMLQLETIDGKIKNIDAGDVFFDKNGENEK